MVMQDVYDQQQGSLFRAPNVVRHPYTKGPQKGPGRRELPTRGMGVKLRVGRRSPSNTLFWGLGFRDTLSRV